MCASRKVEAMGEVKGASGADFKVTRYPQTIEQAMTDTLEAMTDTGVSVMFTKELMVDICTILLKIKHA